MRLSAASVPARAPAAWMRSAARSSEPPDVATVLRLQRSIGNRRTCALLRKVKAAHPTPMSTRRGEFAQITNADPAGGLDRATWSQTVRDAKAALDAGNTKDAIDLYTKLYRDLAATAGATALKDVAAGLPVNVTKTADKGYAPGLNLALGSGGAKAGSTAFVDDAGNFGVRLDAKSKATRPRVAIRYYSGSFKEDKALSLGVLRHEMLHARHHEQALAALDGKKRPGSAVDKILVGEVTQGKSRANTELLAYVEGFMTSFHLIQTGLDPRHPVFVDLLGALDTGTLETWKYADEAVRDEALGRLREYYCNTLDANHRAAFDAWVAAQDAQVAKDAAALKSNSDRGAVSTANLNVERMFEHFVLGLKEVAVASCPAVAKTKRKRAP